MCVCERVRERERERETREDMEVVVPTISKSIEDGIRCLEVRRLNVNEHDDVRSGYVRVRIEGT